MGSASTKFRKHLQAGDEVQALQLYRNNAELRKALDPNCSYGDSHHHETPLHLVSRHGMQMLLGIFLFSKAGNPNKSNARKETCLHCLCQQDSSWQSVHSNKRRAECLNYLLKWRGARLAEGTLEKIDLAAQDEKLNTALHYAAASGLAQCVETLIQQGAPLFVENEDQLTPCDTAERNGHNDIALYLESKMVFSNDEEPVDEEDDISMPPMEEYSGLRPQDLQEAKDMLLVETADMLSVPLFTAEALLRNHEWSRETLLEAWMIDPAACCEKCGVTPPASLFSDKPEVQENLTSPLPSPLHNAPLPLDAECDICANTFLIAEEPVHITCSHKFCKECWERYLNVKIQEGDAHHITCPAFGCTMLVPVDVIEGIVSRDMARRYLQFDIKAFVDSNPDMKWCPFPRCGRAVKLPELDTGNGNGGHSSRTSGGSYRNRIPSDTSRGVDCGGGHYFCWECLEESHEPCSCPNWRSWFEKIADVKPETLHDTEQETELAANCLWLVTNSKPCPNCKSPIQKNEGCNHMKCSKCKHDFCWVCLEQWKRHNSSTGGYFMCNRYEVVKKVEEQNAQMLTDAESKNKNMQELNRFVHYYTRFKNHENSFKLEEPLLKTAKDKMMKLAEAVTDSATAQTETKFVEDAVQQLLKARRVLKCSYVYGYYLDGPGYKKIVFEFMQTELEECTEILSQMVNRLYLRTPRRKIIDQAHIVQRKRQEFIMAISKGLVPAETPPSVRKKRKKKKKMASDVVDEDLHRAIVESIKEVDPSNPWIKDASGKHTNVVALLDWPSEDSDDSETDADQKDKKASIGKCLRNDCPKLRAKNPRTQEAHEYCSRWCMLADKDLKTEEEREEGVSDVALDEHMELLRALEMSRLQYLRESGLLHVPDSQQSAASTKGTQTRRKHRPRSNSAGQDAKSPRPAVSSMEDFDIELQRFQELSTGFPKGDLYDMKLHHPFDAKASGSYQHHARKPSNQTSRFDENKSTIVTRVPNKSVEDLYCFDFSVKCSKQSSQSGLGSPVLGSASSPGPSASSSPSAHSSLTSDRKSYSSSLTAPSLHQPPPDLLSFTSASASAHEETSTICGANNSGQIGDVSNSQSDSNNIGLFGTMFGAIKDLSVSNIHSNESDKTKDFTNKDLASIFASLEMDKDKNQEEEEEGISYSQQPSSSWSSNIPKNDLSSSNTGFSMYSASQKELSGKGLGFSGKSPVTKTSLTDKGKCRVGEGRRKVKGESGRRAEAELVSVDSPYIYNCSRQNKSCSPTGLCHPEKQSEIEDDDDIKAVEGADGCSSCLDEDKVEDGRRREVSLLKMAENLVQMTADVHLRMKEVEKGIRDLDSRSKLESLKIIGGGGLSNNCGIDTTEECATRSNQSDKIIVDDKGCDNIFGATGGNSIRDSSTGSVAAANTENNMSMSSDVDDLEQWFDVSDIVSNEQNTVHYPSSDKNRRVGNLTESHFINNCDDDVNVSDILVNNSDNDKNAGDTAASAEFENDLSIKSAVVACRPTGHSKISYRNLGLRLSGDSNIEQEVEDEEISTSFNSSKYNTSQAEFRNSNTLPFFQSLLLKSPEISDNLLPSFGDDKDFSDSTRSKDLDLSFKDSEMASASLENVNVSSPSSSFLPSSYCDKENNTDEDNFEFNLSSGDIKTMLTSSCSGIMDFPSLSMDGRTVDDDHDAYKTKSSDSPITPSVLTSGAAGGRGIDVVGVREDGGEEDRIRGKGRGKGNKKWEEGGKSKKSRGKHRKEEFLDSVYV